jgi:hypothetical protein
MSRIDGTARRKPGEDRARVGCEGLDRIRRGRMDEINLSVLTCTAVTRRDMGANAVAQIIISADRLHEPEHADLVLVVQNEIPARWLQIARREPKLLGELPRDLRIDIDPALPIDDIALVDETTRQMQRPCVHGSRCRPHHDDFTGMQTDDTRTEQVTKPPLRAALCAPIQIIPEPRWERASEKPAALLPPTTNHQNGTIEVVWVGLGRDKPVRVNPIAAAVELRRTRTIDRDFNDGGMLNAADVIH